MVGGGNSAESGVNAFKAQMRRQGTLGKGLSTRTEHILPLSAFQVHKAPGLESFLQCLARCRLACSSVKSTQPKEAFTKPLA